MSLIDALSASCLARNPAKEAALSRMTTMGIGGLAPLVTVEDHRDLAELRGMPHRWLGKGANTLVCAEPDKQLVLRLGQAFNYYSVEDHGDRSTVRVGASFDLARLVGQCAKRGLVGPEGLAGVPATLGGALYMNAGTGQIWLFDCVARVEVLLPNEAEPRWLERSEVPAVYRSSGLPPGTIFLSCELDCPHGDPAALLDRAKDLKRAKAASQPLSAKSAGCIFKNPSAELGAGRLLDELGMKGARVGDAVLSDIHANFIVNAGSATSADVCELIDQLRRKAWQEREQVLALEVQTWDAPDHLFVHPKEL